MLCIEMFTTAREAEERERYQQSKRDDVEFEEFLQRQERKLSEKLDRIEAKKQRYKNCCYIFLLIKNYF